MCSVCDGTGGGEIEEWWLSEAAMSRRDSGSLEWTEREGGRGRGRVRDEVREREEEGGREIGREEEREGRGK